MCCREASCNAQTLDGRSDCAGEAARGDVMIACRSVRVIVVNRFATVAGGAEKHAVGIARLLRSRGHEVRFLSTQDGRNAEREGVFVEPVGMDFWRGELPPSKRVEVARAALWNRAAARGMDALIASHRPDVVHLHDIYPQLSVAPLVVAARHGVPIVQTLHNYELISASPIDHRGRWLDHGPAPRSVRWLRTALAVVRRTAHVPRVSAWIAVSRFVAETYAQHGVQAETLENFVDPAAEGPPYEDRSGILFVSRLAPEKGVRDVIGLAEALPDVPVEVVGRGALAEEVSAAADRLGNLTYAGEIDAPGVSQRLAAARIAVIPSHWEEPAGLVALEAMATGTPVVAYAAGGLADYVSEAHAGRVVPRSVEALVRASRELYDDPEEWRRSASAGRLAAATTHSPDRYADRLEGVYRRAVEALDRRS
jgi:glycosyltransferase involved in cell wall biosynthesis